MVDLAIRRPRYYPCHKKWYHPWKESESPPGASFPKSSATSRMTWTQVKSTPDSDLMYSKNGVSLKYMDRSLPKKTRRVSSWRWVMANIRWKMPLQLGHFKKVTRPKVIDHRYIYIICMVSSMVSKLESFSNHPFPNVHINTHTQKNKHH